MAFELNLEEVVGFQELEIETLVYTGRREEYRLGSGCVEGLEELSMGVLETRLRVAPYRVWGLVMCNCMIFTSCPHGRTLWAVRDSGPADRGGRYGSESQAF